MKSAEQVEPTSRLMYSDPLSAWKAWTVKGKAEMRSFSTGIMNCWVMRRDGSKVLELCDFVDDVDDVGALAAAPDRRGGRCRRAGSRACRPVRGLRRTPKPTGRGAGLAEGEAAGSVRCGTFAEVVDVAVGDARRAAVKRSSP